MPLVPPSVHSRNPRQWASCKRGACSESTCFFYPKAAQKRVRGIVRSIVGQLQGSYNKNMSKYCEMVGDSGFVCGVLVPAGIIWHH